MGLSLRKSPLPHPILPFFYVCLSLFILRPPLHRQEHGGIVPLDGALPQGLDWCPGKGPGTKPSQSGVGCRAATLTSLGMLDYHLALCRAGQKRTDSGAAH